MGRTNVTSLLLTNCNIVDVRNGTVFKDKSLRVNDKIEEIGDGNTVSEDHIDLKGVFLLPGLINVHCHLSMVWGKAGRILKESQEMTAYRAYYRAHQALMSGITTIRTLGERYSVDLTLRSAHNHGWIDAPRILAAGSAITTTGGHGIVFSGARQADGPDEILKVTREQLSLGADQIKLMITGGLSDASENMNVSQMNPDEIKAAVWAASKKGAYVTVHVNSSEAVLEAADCGVKCFEHCYQLEPYAAKKIKSVGGYVVPTLAVTRTPEWARENGFDNWELQRAASRADSHLKSTRNAIDAGVMIANGTDQPPGDTEGGVNLTAKEAEFLVEAGMSPLDAVRASTINGAKLCHIDNTVGLIEPGYFADLIAVRENPIDDIKALRNILFVMHNGKIVRNDLSQYKSQLK